MMKILYVEDCEATAEMLKISMDRFCTDIIVSIDIAVSVSDAIVQFSADKHVAALIDWNLPDGKATDVAELLRSQNPTLPIVFLSALFTNDHYQEAQLYSPMLCLVKDHRRDFFDNILNHISKK